MDIGTVMLLRSEVDNLKGQITELEKEVKDDMRKIVDYEMKIRNLDALLVVANVTIDRLWNAKSLAEIEQLWKEREGEQAPMPEFYSALIKAIA